MKAERPACASSGRSCVCAAFRIRECHLTTTLPFHITSPDDRAAPRKLASRKIAKSDTPNLRKDSKPASAVWNGSRLPRIRPQPILTSTNYYQIDKIGFVSQIRTRYEPPRALRKSGLKANPGDSRNLSRSTSPFFALRAQICTNPSSVPVPNTRATHTKNRYLLRIGFVSKNSASTLPLCIREAHEQPPAGYRRLHFVGVAQEGGLWPGCAAKGRVHYQK